MEFYERSTAASSKAFSHNQQIENFSIRLCSGSNLASSREHFGCHWTFILDGREDGINVMLGRDDARLQGSASFAKIKLSIVDCFGFSWLQAEKNFRFESSSYTRSVLFLERDYLLKANWGLNELRYVPNDTLTLKWEITTYEFAMEASDGFVSSGYPWKFLVAKWRFFLLCFTTAFVLVLVTMVAARITIYLYNCLQSAMFWFLNAANQVFKFIPGLAVLLFIVLLVIKLLLYGSHNRARQTTHVLERRQIVLPYNRGTLRYETLRSMSGTSSYSNRYNNRARYINFN